MRLENVDGVSRTPLLKSFKLSKKAFREEKTMFEYNKGNFVF